MAAGEGVLSENSVHTVSGTLDLNGTDQTVQSLELKGGSIDGNRGVLNAQKITSSGGVIKDLGKGLIDGLGESSIRELRVESGVTVFSGDNYIDGDLNVVGGVAKGGNHFSFSSGADTTATGRGILDLMGYKQYISQVKILEEGDYMLIRIILLKLITLICVQVRSTPLSPAVSLLISIAKKVILLSRSRTHSPMKAELSLSQSLRQMILKAHGPSSKAMCSTLMSLRKKLIWSSQGRMAMSLVHILLMDSGMEMRML